MFSFIVFVGCFLIALSGILALPSLLYHKEIKITWRFFVMVVGPAIVIGILIRDPWFATDATWRWGRLILLFSWIPGLIELEHRGHVIYTSSTRKWFSRWLLYSLLSVFTIWGLWKAEGWGLVQANVSGKTWCWLVENNNGEDGYIFTKIYKKPLQSQKLLDSVGSVYTYYMRWVGNQIELSSTVDRAVRLYNPITGKIEYGEYKEIKAITAN